MNDNALRPEHMLYALEIKGTGTKIYFNYAIDRAKFMLTNNLKYCDVFLYPFYETTKKAA